MVNSPCKHTNILWLNNSHINDKFVFSPEAVVLIWLWVLAPWHFASGEWYLPHTYGKDHDAKDRFLMKTHQKTCTKKNLFLCLHFLTFNAQIWFEAMFIIKSDLSNIHNKTTKWSIMDETYQAHNACIIPRGRYLYISWTFLTFQCL